MEEICRTCLTVTNAEHILSEESEIWLKIRTSLNIQMNLGERLPSAICESCFKKIDEFIKFREEVLINEHRLTEMLQNNTVKEFYSNIKGDFHLKEEKETPIKKELENIDEDYFDSMECFTSIEEPETIKKEKIFKKLKGSKTKMKENKIKDKRKKIIENLEFQGNGENIHDALKCLMCFKICKTQQDLSRHYKDDHTQTEVSINDNFVIVEDNDRTKLKCNVCGDLFDSRNDVIEHNSKRHVRERPYICKLCGRTYMTAYAIVRHGRVHGGYRQFCSFGCGYSSPHGGALRCHEKRHNNEHSYQCKECGKGFMVKTWYDQHQNVHNNVKPFVCDFCGMAFHMHRYLMAHRSRMHPGMSAVSRYACVHCRFTCESKVTLDAHVKTEHKIGVESASKHLCDLCGKTFTRLELLSNHKKIHYGIKPFVCGICNKAFSKKYNLQVHMSVHSESKNRPQCNTCGKLFAQKSTLHRHIRRRHPDELT